MAEPAPASDNESGAEIQQARSGGAEAPALDGAVTTQAWLLPTVRGLKALLALPAGWNSYHAAPIDPAVLMTALELLTERMPPNAPPPAVVPMSRGGVQLEWHEGGVDLEVSIDPAGRIEAAYGNSQGASWEKDVTDNLAPLAEALAELGSRG